MKVMARFMYFGRCVTPKKLEMTINTLKLEHIHGKWVTKFSCWNEIKIGIHFPGMFAVGKGKYGEKCDFRILFAPKTEINHKKIDCCQKLPWKWQTIIGQYKKKKIDPFFRCFGCHEEQIWSDMDALGWLVPQIMKLPINALQIKQNTQKYQATNQLLQVHQNWSVFQMMLSAGRVDTARYVCFGAVFPIKLNPPIKSWELSRSTWRATNKIQSVEVHQNWSISQVLLSSGK